MYKSILDVIGNTPLVQIFHDLPCSMHAKLEYLNPGGSVKDRSALYMIEQAEKAGILKPGGTLIDASSGNHGIAIAMIGAIKGYKTIICMSEKNSLEKRLTVQAYGAEVILCPPVDHLEDPRSYHSIALKLAQEIPNSFMPNQYFNLKNREAHYHSLGAEIWRQTNGTITHFFAAAGTGGTISGAGQYLKEQNSHIKIIAVDAENSYRSTNGNPKPYKTEGIGVDFEAPNLDYNCIDEFITANDDASFAMLQQLARKEGVLAGLSSGAVAAAAYPYAQKHMKTGDVAVMIFGDSGRAYLSKNVF